MLYARKRMFRRRASALQPMYRSRLPRWRGADDHARHAIGRWPRGPRPHQILQMFAHWLLVAEVVMLFHQTVEQRLISGTPHLFHCDRPHVLQFGFDRALVHQHRLWPRPLRQWIVAPVGDRWYWISPARSSINSRPRHTMSRSVPLLCRQSHASHSRVESLRRLSAGCSSIRARI